MLRNKMHNILPLAIYTGVVVAVSLSFALRRSGALSWAAFLASLLLTAFLTIYFARLISRAARIKELAGQQTLDLRRINAQLQGEIGERRKTEDKLHKLFVAVEQSPVIIVITDCKGDIEYVNPKFTQLTGYTLDEVMGKNPRVLKSGEQPGEFYEQLWKTITSGKDWKGEFHNKKKSGELYWESALISPIRSPQGAITNFIALKEDITERKRMEKELKMAYQTMHEIIDNAPFGIYIVDEKGNVEYVNPAMVQIAGSSYEQFMAMNVLEFEPYKEAGLDVKIRNALNGEYFKLNDIEYTSFFGKKFTCRNFYGIPLNEASGKKAMVVVEDITERKRLEVIKDDFVSTTSHDLRTPLAIMKESLSQMADGMYGGVNERQKHFLGLALSGIDRISHIVGSLLDISRLESGKLALKRQVIDARDLIGPVAGIFRDLIQSKGLKFRETLPDRPLEIYADKDKIIQVLTNLVNNAFKFTEKGIIEIGVSEQKDEIEFSVIDTGTGISAEHMPKLFNKSSQFGALPKDAEKIAGLGLVISKGIVELHQGKIHIESEPGKGTKVFFTLPKNKV